MEHDSRVTRQTSAPFVYNAWYIAAWPEELDAGLTARTILNEPIVLFRDSHGRAVALEDRCCHRGAPLSHGQIVDGAIQCGYHGMIFDGCGACIGRHGGVLAPGEKAFTTMNRNFVGRMGHPESEVYLAGPAVAAASAVLGKIGSPEEVVA